MNQRKRERGLRNYDHERALVVFARGTENQARADLCGKAEVHESDILGAGLSPVTLAAIVILKDEIGRTGKVLVRQRGVKLLSTSRLRTRPRPSCFSCSGSASKESMNGFAALVIRKIIPGYSTT